MGASNIANPAFDPDDGDQYAQELYQEKQSFSDSVLVTSLQTEKARSILAKLHHYHTQSNVAQHEVVTFDYLYHQSKLVEAPKSLF